MSKFHGHPTRRLSSDHLKVDYLLTAGPRLVRLCLAGSDQNLLGETPTVGWETPAGYYNIYGGHRLWAAPEEPGLTYVPDSSGLSIRDLPGGVELTWEPAGPGLTKTILLELAPDRPALRLTQRITNRFNQPVRVAPWGITVLPLGGVAYLPCPPVGTSFQPDRSLVLWPYTRWNDPRLVFSDNGIKVRADAAMPPIKVGALAAPGWAAYLRDGILLMKCFDVPPGEYPDRGCNVEIYCSDKLLELETLAPLMRLPPGASTEYTEIWEIHTGPAAQEIITGF